MAENQANSERSDLSACYNYFAVIVIGCCTMHLVHSFVCLCDDMSELLSEIFQNKSA